jgi:hypothetical protein
MGGGSVEDSKVDGIEQADSDEDSWSVVRDR